MENLSWERAAAQPIVVSQLDIMVREGGKPAQLALKELSDMAMGGNEQAGQAVNEIDALVNSGGLIISYPNLMEREPSNRFGLRDILTIITHPVFSLRAFGRQMAVKVELKAPPHTSTWEDFPRLPIGQAIRALREAEEESIGVVPKSAWSKADQERMEQGQQPRGIPEHPNV
ncbi:hypothetical protein COT75_01430 [Candidatus Beckwithbacteria bacterium CG10_big_fil_rev_8_21_14_0_10_34_10]|uniref:Uncharacterized protein n=1 Tax=Candidatus Beckwithbacteria bacterium CG10_big_fil_rev_8_21_14_0_10_34_10 TaxID=1974495 RepID=A0A2H0W9W0_9BACT|nr:MAG: hypothetical protein COT75_01430 [Candidatus Beckwithbacteria bacterium CG10_big_fil_rev_8_21_14_0_10_34_10]